MIRTLSPGLLLAGWLGICAPLAAQSPRATEPRRWGLEMQLSGTDLLQEGAYNHGVGIGLDLNRRLDDKTSLAIGVGFYWLGSTNSRVRAVTPPPDFDPAFRISTGFSRMLRLGLELDRRLAASASTPSLHVGLAAYGSHSQYRSELVDSATGAVIQHNRLGGWAWGPGASVGVRVRFLSLPRGLRAGLEATVRGALVHTDESWTSIRFATAGVTIGW